MDISLLDTSSASSHLTILHPVTRVETDIVIEIADQDHAKVREARRVLQDKIIKARRIGRQFDAAEMERNAIEVLAAATLSWVGVELDGKSLACNMDNARLVYDRVPVIREQVDAFINDKANFMKASV